MSSNLPTMPPAKAKCATSMSSDRGSWRRVASRCHPTRVQSQPYWRVHDNQPDLLRAGLVADASTTLLERDALPSAPRRCGLLFKSFDPVVNERPGGQELLLAGRAHVRPDLRWEQLPPQ